MLIVYWKYSVLYYTKGLWYNSLVGVSAVVNKGWSSVATDLWPKVF